MGKLSGKKKSPKWQHYHCKFISNFPKSAVCPENTSERSGTISSDCEASWGKFSLRRVCLEDVLHDSVARYLFS